VGSDQQTTQLAGPVHHYILNSFQLNRGHCPNYFTPASCEEHTHRMRTTGMKEKRAHKGISNVQDTKSLSQHKAFPSSSHSEVFEGFAKAVCFA